MDLRQLTTFAHVAELGSLSRAAGRLHVAQPALSRQMRLLEEELKVALFTRHGRGMALTPAGEMLRVRAADILRQVEQARTDLIAETGAVRGRVTFGLTPTMGAVMTTRLVERCLAIYPEVTLRVVHAFSGYLIEWLQAGEIDLAVVYGGTRATGVRQSPLLEENLFLVTSPARPPPRGGRIGLKDLARTRLVLPGLSHGLRKQVEREAQRHGVALDIAVEADDLQVLKELAAKGVAATILPLSAVHGEVAAGRLCAALIVRPHIARRMVLAEPATRLPSTAMLRFRDLLADEVAALMKDGVWRGELPAAGRRGSPSRGAPPAAGA